MLEPRRLATRAAARRMAQLRRRARRRHRRIPRPRRDRASGARTRIEVVTEGILTRMLQPDPSLEGVGLVIFDEFHERSLDADLALALTLETRDVLRPDLRVLVMSATLDGARVARLLGDAPIVTSEGRAFPVETRYVERRRRPARRGRGGRGRAACAGERRGRRARVSPGRGRDPSRARAARESASCRRDVRVLPLHGSLSADAQDDADSPEPARGSRKVVLATSIAETSLTIEGVRVVIDSGLSRVPRFSPRTGMTRLETVRVSQASADQRRGRAGRLTPGVCYRLWAEHEQHHLVAHTTPEILEADLAPVALELAAAGVADPATLRWLDPPPAAAYGAGPRAARGAGRARRRPAGRITPHGRRMAELPMHPRLAHMVVRADALGALPRRLRPRGAAERARPHSRRCGIGARRRHRDAAALMRGGARRRRAARWMATRCGGSGSSPSACVRRLARLAAATGLRRGLPVDPGRLLLAFAYPDRIGQLRAPQVGPLRAPQRQRRDARERAVALRLAVHRRRGARRPTAGESHLSRGVGRSRGPRAALRRPDRARAGSGVGPAGARRRRARARAARRDRAGRAPASRRGSRSRGRRAPRRASAAKASGRCPWSDGARSLRERLAFLHAIDASWPDVSDAALAETLGDVARAASGKRALARRRRARRPGGRTARPARRGIVARPSTSSRRRTSSCRAGAAFPIDYG